VISCGQMKPSRRSVLSGTAAGLFEIAPSSVLAQPAPSDRIHLGPIGIGGRRRQFLRPEAAEHISAKLQDRNLTVRITAVKVWAAMAKS
jgi:hypothetical protein